MTATDTVTNFLSYIDQMLDGIPEEEARQMCSENAARIFRHPLPANQVAGQ